MSYLSESTRPKIQALQEQYPSLEEQTAKAFVYFLALVSTLKDLDISKSDIIDCVDTALTNIEIETNSET